MIELGDNKYIIGFDNGYQFGKTANLMFDNGVFPLGKVEPSVNEHSLKFERKYYKVAEGRAAITEDKVSDENARLLTMVAIAKELSAVGVRKAEIILAVGLPFSDYGREKKELIKYYEEKPVMKYEYQYMENLGREFERLRKVKVTDQQIKEYIELLLPIENGASLTTVKNTRKLREDMRARYYDAPDLKDVGNNAYRFINAVSDFATHSNPLRRTANYQENLFMRTYEGNPMIDRAYQLVAA